MNDKLYLIFAINLAILLILSEGPFEITNGFDRPLFLPELDFLQQNEADEPAQKIEPITVIFNVDATNNGHVSGKQLCLNDQPNNNCEQVFTDVTTNFLTDAPDGQETSVCKIPGKITEDGIVVNTNQETLALINKNNPGMIIETVN